MRKRNVSSSATGTTPTTNRKRSSSITSLSKVKESVMKQPTTSNTTSVASSLSSNTSDKYIKSNDNNSTTKSKSRGRTNQRESSQSRTNEFVPKNGLSFMSTIFPQLLDEQQQSQPSSISTKKTKHNKNQRLSLASSSSSASSVGSHDDHDEDDNDSSTEDQSLITSSHSASNNSGLDNHNSNIHGLISSPVINGSTTDNQLLLEQPQTKRWKDWWLRFGMTLLMIFSCFAYIYITKQPGVVILVFILQGLIYRELINIAVVDSKERDMPGFRFFYYYWFFVYAYFMYIRTTYKYILSGIRGIPVDDVLDNSPTPATLPSLSTMLSSTSNNTTTDTFGSSETTNNDISNTTNYDNISSANESWLMNCIEFIVTRYEPITFVLCIIGFVAFVISLRQRRNFRYQFSQLAYCHMALLLVVVQSTYLAANVFHGLLWFFLPCGLVVANDSFAYVFGFFFGRTPLIRLSPKKTVEGFIGGSIATVLYALVSTHIYTTLEWGNTKYLMTCPVENGIGWQINHCDINMQASQLYKSYPLEDWTIGYIFPYYLQKNLYLSRIQIHAVALSIFASFVAPFGGFFASGFKRAFKIKDFGTSIPGHGGFTDRMDCQLIMSTFAYIYGMYVLNLGQSTELIPHYLSFLKRHLTEDDLKALYIALGQYLNSLTHSSSGTTI